MIIHSIMSPDDIFPLQNSVADRTELVPIKNGFLELNNKRRLQRVISTDPRDYLNKNYQIDKYLP